MRSVKELLDIIEDLGTQLEHIPSDRWEHFIYRYLATFDLTPAEHLAVVGSIAPKHSRALPAVESR